MQNQSDYATALEALQTATKFGINPTLENAFALCDALGRPQDKYRAIQVTGTNGKTSTCRYIAEILRVLGYRVGLYTSPELVRVEERVEIDGEVVAPETFAAAILKVSRLGLPYTQFELLTAAALEIFAEQEVEYAVLEVGMGGRWDATSVVTPALAMITGVGLDHCAILGDTLEAIACEKAAIIKPGSVAVVGRVPEPTLSIFQEQAQRVDAPFTHYTGACPDFTPTYQGANAALAACAVGRLLGREFGSDVETVLRELPIPGRFETLRKDPLLLIDAAHNPQSAHFLAAALQERFTESELGQTTLLLAALSDKDAAGIAAELTPLFGRVALTQTASPRALPVAELAAVVGESASGAPILYPDVKSALDGLSSADLPVVATGSITLAGEVKALMCDPS
ncbi:MAG: bifunctional folylpolyglutamate synthase/dihydrofolate synthase [Coriobacteriales bacterium]|jgi:dihydrofolate synthase/folylpolyglutamate synthase|nr:bifunctional folylpolyglutamate synthase/dihydrofolate synthase [Coriobacteriales bacterium]